MPVLRSDEGGSEVSVPTRKSAGSWGYTDQVADACPNASDPKHRIGPSGYNARADWADQMIKSHVQSQCQRCELWVIWTPKAVSV
jgi:hypothetical protein